jgi:hypothetical protein
MSGSYQLLYFRRAAQEPPKPCGHDVAAVCIDTVTAEEAVTTMQNNYTYVCRA